jgi:hypothetical protein
LTTPNTTQKALKNPKIGNLLTSPTAMSEVDEDMMEGVEEVALALPSRRAATANRTRKKCDAATLHDYKRKRAELNRSRETN